MSEDDGSSEYTPSARDRHVVETTLELLDKLRKSDLPTPAQLASIARVRAVFSLFPRAQWEETVSISLSGPTREFGDHRIYHSWDVRCEMDVLEVVTGGYFRRPSTGGDSFTNVMWTISEGESGSYSDSTGEHWLVDDQAPFHEEVRAMDLAEEGWSVEVYDDENALLDLELELEAEEEAEPDEHESHGEVYDAKFPEERLDEMIRLAQWMLGSGVDSPEGMAQFLDHLAKERGIDAREIRQYSRSLLAAISAGRPDICFPEDWHSIYYGHTSRETDFDSEEKEPDEEPGPSIPTPVTAAEKQLVALIDREKTVKTDITAINPSDCCDLCGTPIKDLNHLVDGSIGSLQWAWMCPECWSQKGEGIGTGQGQLFTRQPDGQWILTAGFES